MDADEDDIYAPDVPESIDTELTKSEMSKDQTTGLSEANEDLAVAENGSIENEDASDSDIDIITEKQEDGKPERPKSTKPAQAPANVPLPVPATTEQEGKAVNAASSSSVVQPDKNARPGSSYPPVRVSEVNIDEKPIHEPTGKNILDVDMDNDFAEDDQPWRRPGSDMTDYFNYGFDEFTWANYCLKQKDLRKEVTDSKNQLNEMQTLMSSGLPAMPSLPSIQNMPTPAAMPPNLPSVPGMGEIPPEMQQMFAQMMSQGLDPTQMDPASMMQMMSAGLPGGQSDQGQAFANSGFNAQAPNAFGGFSNSTQQAGRGRGRRW